MVIPWTDPIVVASFVWLAWLLVVVLFHAFYRPARQGRKVAYVTISSFIFLSLVMSIVWWMPTQHGREHDGQNRLPGDSPPAIVALRGVDSGLCRPPEHRQRECG